MYFYIYIHIHTFSGFLSLISFRLSCFSSIAYESLFSLHALSSLFSSFFQSNPCIEYNNNFSERRDSGFLSHVQLVHQFRCSLPQPRAVPVKDLLIVGPGPDEIFYPASTVLARCAESGCCPDIKQICAPIETRNVSLVFMVRHRVDQQRDRHHEIIHALEHTKCACIDETLPMKNSRL